MVDWKELKLDDTQFAYQAGSSTKMCTWLVIETMDYFTRNRGEVYACSMDMTKPSILLSTSCF